MKTKLFKLSQICGWLLVAQAASAQYMVPLFVELNNGQTLEDKTRTRVSEVYVNATAKINEKYSVVPELRTDVFYKEGGAKNHIKIKHAYARIYLYQYGVDNFGPWKLDIGYRYRLPTEDKYQKQGNFGQIGVRPSLTATFGRFTMVARDLVFVFLQRDGTQRNMDINNPTPVVKGNPIVGHTLELIPSYEIGGGLVAAANIATSNVIYSKIGNSKTNWVNEFEQEYEIGYKSATTRDTYIGLSYYTTTDISPHATPKWYDKNVSKVNLKISRAF